MYGYIYKTTNKLNNKIYIGQKKSDKFLFEKYLGSGLKLKSAIDHYGEYSFKVELIEECDSFESLNEREIYWIAYFNSTDPEIGYNISLGGNTPRGIPAWNKGLTKEEDSRLIVSDETREKHSKSLKLAYLEGRRKPLNPSPELRAKMGAKNKGKHPAPTTKGKISITNGIKNLFIYPDELSSYEEQGWYKGKTMTKPAWNKGLTKSDPRVAKYTESKNKKLAEGYKIGFCNCKGNHFSKGQKIEEYRESINK